MRSTIRRDAEGWTPVFIALLFLIIAMFLASLFGPITTPPMALGVAIARSADGTNWTLAFTSVPTGLSQNGTFLSLSSSAGASLLNATSLYHLEGAGLNGVEYMPVQTGPAYTSCLPGDEILISVSRYPAGTQATIANGASILFIHTLQ